MHLNAPSTTSAVLGDSLPQSASVSFPFTVAEIVALGAVGRFTRAEKESLVARAVHAARERGAALAAAGDA